MILRALLLSVARLSIVLAFVGALLGLIVAAVVGTGLPILVFAIVFAGMPWLMLGILAAIDRCFE